LLVVSTLTNAINKGYLKGFPDLTAQCVYPHIQIKDVTKKGHMDQTWQGQCSTQPNPTITSNANILLNNNNVLPDHINEGLTNLVFMVIHNITRLVFSNQTGCFPITSNRGHKYLVIFYIYDANFIASVSIKNQTKQELLRAYQITYKYLSSCKFKPCLHKMDNETSKDVKDFIQSQQTTLQYTPPDIHCKNSAKQAICTWKNHFTAGITSLPKSFPIANWCCLTNQGNYTINMLCPCCQNPFLSTFEAMEGSYSFDATPMAPPGTKVLVHLKLTRCKSWSFHASNGWYIGPSLKHYRRICAIMEGTGGKCLTNTFRFKHHAMSLPIITPTNLIIAATQHLTAAISGVQESPPDKLHGIATLRHIILGKTPPVPVPIDTQPIQLPSLLFLNIIDKEPVHIWDPPAMQLPPIYTTSVPTTNSMPKSTAPGPAIIENNDDVTPPPRQAQTCTQHQSSHVHLINSAITKALMPLIDLKPTASFPAHWYIAALQALLKNAYGVIHKTNSPVNANSVNFIGAIIDNVTGNVLEYCHLIKSKSHCTIWQHSFSNKLGCLFQGICNIKGNETYFFICKQQMPQHKQATYGRICCNYCPQKDEPHCTRLTVGGDQITYNSNKSTPTATLVTAKLLINSTISTPKTKFYWMDLSNFYLMTPMKEYEYMQLQLELFPGKIIHQYNLRDLVDEQGWVYIKIWMGMYGLPQAGILANKLLE
jgi:hypothetical protein